MLSVGESRRQKGWLRMLVALSKSFETSNYHEKRRTTTKWVPPGQKFPLAGLQDLKLVGQKQFLRPPSSVERAGLDLIGCCLCSQSEDIRWIWLLPSVERESRRAATRPVLRYAPHLVWCFLPHYAITGRKQKLREHLPLRRRFAANLQAGLSSFCYAFVISLASEKPLHPNHS